VSIPRTWPHRAVQSGLTCGRDTGLPVSLAYQAPYCFTGEIAKVLVEVAADGQTDPSIAGRAAEIEQ
jgi:hypothetical protein